MEIIGTKDIVSLKELGRVARDHQVGCSIGVDGAITAHSDSAVIAAKDGEAFRGCHPVDHCPALPSIHTKFGTKGTYY